MTAVGLVKIPAYCDLGGDNNIISDMECYHELCERIREGHDVVSRVIQPQDMVYTARGVPIDMSGGEEGDTSVVYVKRWVSTTIRMVTYTNRTVVMYQQLVGFVARSTPLLLLGKTACRLCGFRTIREQGQKQSFERLRITGTKKIRVSLTHMRLMMKKITERLAMQTMQEACDARKMLR